MTALNKETPYVGDKAAQDMAGVVAPNVLRAVAEPERPAPDAEPRMKEQAE